MKGPRVAYFISMYIKIGTLGLILFPFLAFGEIRITEVMYDLPGADDGREWVEILNTGTESVDLTGWKFFDGSNHVLNAPPKNGGTGSLVLPASSYAMLADDAVIFLKDKSTSVSVIDTIMSLSQQKDKTYTLKLLNADGTVVHEMSYSISLGANGDGNSLQLISGVWKPAIPTPGTANANEASAPPAQTNHNENSSASSSQTEITAPAQTTNASSASEPVPSLLVKVSAPASVTVGAETVFSATVFGLKKEPIPNARVIWTFGNGATKEGASVRYAYNIPGSYAVIADAASGGLAGTAKFVVKAIKPDIRVSQVIPGAHGFVEIENMSTAELDVSGWGLASNNSVFTIPDHTIILPSAKVAFPVEVTKLPIIDAHAQLLFPNGTVAAEYVEGPKKPEPVIIPKLITPTFSKNPPPQPPTTTPAAIALSVSDNTNTSSVLGWLLGVVGVCLVGVGALAAFRFKPTQKDERSDAEKFAAEVHIDTI